MFALWTIKVMDTYRAFEHINRPMGTPAVYRDEEAIAVSLPWDDVFEISLDTYVQKRLSMYPQQDTEQRGGGAAQILFLRHGPL